MIRYTPHYTVAEYEQWEGDWELWNGIPIATTPSSFGKHQFVSANLVGGLRSALRNSGRKAFVLHEIDWVIADDMVVRPDVVVCDEVPDRHLAHAPMLAVEILSSSTADKDRAAKFRLYEEQGVYCYLIVDPDKESIDAYVLNAAGEYEPSSFADRLTIPITQAHSVDIPVNAIFE